MNWNEAYMMLCENIKLNYHLDNKCLYKIVIRTPPQPCNIKKEEGFHVQIGKNNAIPVPIEMLKQTFEKTKLNDGIYNRSVLLDLYPQKVNDKPCYVHVIGRLFESAGIFEKIDRHNYKLIDL
jgi:hypothetical protein